mgnify:CR=1 FL=1
MPSSRIQNFSQNVLSSLINTASKGTMQARLCAGVMKNNNVLINKAVNQDRSYLRGYASCSLHAEIAAISSYFGKSLFYNKRWCILPYKRKQEIT